MIIYLPPHHDLKLSGRETALSVGVALLSYINYVKLQLSKHMKQSSFERPVEKFTHLCRSVPDHLFAFHPYMSFSAALPSIDCPHAPQSDSGDQGGDLSRRKWSPATTGPAGPSVA